MSGQSGQLREHVLGAFNQGGPSPTIAVFNQATVPLGVDLDALIAAMQIYIDTCIFPIWGVRAILQKTTGLVPGNWAMVFLDNADTPGALAYHDLTPDGLPISKVFVKTTLQDNALVSVSASHELVEMLVDPGIQMLCTGAVPGVIYAYEAADPVEETWFPINGIQMSNFVYPAFFESFHAPNSVKFDYLHLLQKPFQLLSGGYQIVFAKGRWKQVFGSEEKALVFKSEDRRLHRSEKIMQHNLCEVLS